VQVRSSLAKFEGIEDVILCSFSAADLAIYQRLLG